jgi:ATP-dependent Clp protease protease subunit
MAILKFYNEITTEEEKQMNRWCMGTDGVCFKDIDEFVGSMEADDNKIDIRIHCVGGSVHEGWAMYDKLRQSGKEISCTVEGKCASMATVILLSAPKERRKALQNAKFCVHNPYTCGWVLGDAVTADDLERAASSLREEQERILNLYVERCGCDKDAMQALMDEDKYIDTDKALELGLIGEIVAPISAKKENDYINNREMEEKGMVKVKQNMLDKVLAKLGLARIEDVVVSMELNTASGATLTVERESGDPQVGDTASPDGEHVMPDGSTIVVADGVITEIRPYEEEEEEGEEKDEKDSEVEALKASLESKDAEIAELKAQLEAKAKSSEDEEILKAVKVAGGKAWLAKACSTYKVEGRKVSGSLAKETHEENIIERELRERREGTFKRS